MSRVLLTGLACTDDPGGDGGTTPFGSGVQPGDVLFATSNPGAPFVKVAPGLWGAIATPGTIAQVNGLFGLASAAAYRGIRLPADGSEYVTGSASPTATRHTVDGRTTTTYTPASLTLSPLPRNSAVIVVASGEGGDGVSVTWSQASFDGSTDAEPSSSIWTGWGHLLSATPQTQMTFTGAGNVGGGPQISVTALMVPLLGGGSTMMF